MSLPNKSCKLTKRKIDSIDKGRELKKSRSRLSELDGLFQRLYEDRASGAIGERKLENGEQTQAITIYYRFVGNIS